MFVSQTLAGLPDQDSYYDLVDCLEEQSIEATAQRHLSRKGTDLDLIEQFNIYEVRKPTLLIIIMSYYSGIYFALVSKRQAAAEYVCRSCNLWNSLNFKAYLIQVTLRHEDGDDEAQLPPNGRKDRRRASVGCTNERQGPDRRRSRRHSLQNSRDHAAASAAPNSSQIPSSSFLSAGGHRVEDICERWGKDVQRNASERNVLSVHLHFDSNFDFIWWGWWGWGGWPCI